MSSERKLYVGVIVSLLLTIVFVLPSSAVNSNSGNFTVTPDNVYLNWSSMNISLTSNNDSVILLVHNTSTSVQPQYFPSNYYNVDVDGADSIYKGFNSSERLMCFTESGNSGMKFVVQNSSGSYTNMSDVLNNTNSTLFTLTAYQFCPPGFYSGQFNVTQNGTNDYATLNMSVSIPISGQNTFNESGSKAGFKGIFSGSGVHIYYFNTSLAENLTGVTINLSWTDYNQDVDIFLFDSSGNLLGKSVEKTGRDAVAYVSLPETSDMWQIRISGNVSSSVNYTGWLYFTTLNITNTSNPNERLSSLNFGSLDPNETSGRINFTLVNVDTKIWSGVKERKEIYRIDSWTSQNQANSYQFFVPNFAQKVKVKIEWNGPTRWVISLNDSNNNFIGNSSGKYYAANLSNATQEEFIVFNGPFNTTNDGLWNITVNNLTSITGNYNLTAYVWIPNSLIISDYPTSFTFNATGVGNYSKNVSVYVSIPSNNITNGTYEGFIEYYKPGEWNLRLPLNFHVKAGLLLINDTLETITVHLKDNIGFNRLGSNALKVSLPVRNIGEYNITYTNTTSDYKLNNTAHTDKYIDFNVTWPDNPIKANSTDELNITIYISTSKTGDVEGIYRGNITFDTSTQSANSSSYPFKKFVVIIEVNLTKYLEVNVTSVSPTFVSQTENSTNITASITVKLANGSYISENETMKIYDFTSTKLKEGNVTTTTYTLQNITGNNPSGVACPSSNPSHICMIKSTLPGGSVGGRYYYIVSLRFNTSVLGGDGVNLTGTGTSSQQIVINNTGIFLSGTDHPPDVYEGETIVYTVLMRNYGPLEAKDLQIRFDKGSCKITVTRNTNMEYTNCTSATSGSNSDTDWKIPSLSGYSGWWKLSWNIKGNDVDEDSSCSSAAVKVISNHSHFPDITSIYINVLNNESTTTTQQQQQQESTNIGCSSNSDCADDEYCYNGVCTAVSCPNGHVSNHVCIPYQRKLSITEYPREASVMQGSTTSLKVTVKNIGDLSATTKLEIIPSLNGTTFSVSPDSYTLLSGISGIFTVKVSVSNKTEIGRYNLQFKAYATENSSVYDTKDFTLVVEPTEETKIYVNKTYNDIKKMFNDISLQFEGIIPTMVSDINYTRANRTYTRLITMLKEAENYLRAEKYVDAYMLLKEANESLKSFQEEVNKLIEEKMTKESSNMWIFIGIGIAVVVIGALLVYLLLPPKKGYHPAFGYTPPKKRSVKLKINFALAKLKDILNIVSHMKRIHHKIKQKRITDFEVSESVEKLRRKVYSGDYTKLTQFAYKYKKGSMKKK